MNGGDRMEKNNEIGFYICLIDKKMRHHQHVWVKANQTVYTETVLIHKAVLFCYISLNRQSLSYQSGFGYF